jgi:hypothetical protein
LVAGCESGHQRYDETAAKLAWTRTLEFFDKYLRGIGGLLHFEPAMLGFPKRRR